MRSWTLYSVLLVASGPGAGAAAEDWTILGARGFDGQALEYHDGEAPATPGEGWLALHLVEGEWRLTPAQVATQRVFDPVLDTEGEKTGLRIDATPEDATIVLRHPALSQGVVATPTMRFGIDAPVVAPGQPDVVIAFASKRYVLSARDGAAALSDGERSTMLTSVATGGADSDDRASVAWAGDLDRDGRLDLIIYQTRHNSGGYCLYLSSTATNGALVAEAGCHIGVGC